jgi:lipocalin
VLVGTGCTTQPATDEIHTESYVDLERFMGEWYVIASIPTAIDTTRRSSRSFHNAGKA